MTLAELLQSHVARSPDATALICGERSMTFADLDSSSDALESVKCGLYLVILQAAVLSAGDYGQRVSDVQLAHQVRVEFETGRFEESGGGAIADIVGLDGISLLESKALHWAMINLEQRLDVMVIAIGEQQAVPRH